MNGVVFSFKALKVWAGIGVGFQCRLLFLFSHPAAQASHRRVSELWTGFVCFGYSFKLSRLIMKLATINEEPQYDTPLGNFHSLFTPFSKVADPWKRTEPVWLLFVNDTELEEMKWKLLSSEEMAKVYRLYVGIVIGKIFSLVHLSFSLSISRRLKTKKDNIKMICK